MKDQIMENLKSRVEKKNCKENSITKKKKKNIFDGYNYYCSSCMSVCC